MIYHLLKYLVGSVFLISGFVKVIDPIGTAIKLEEYFHVFGQDLSPLFELLIPYSLTFSVFLCIAEGLLGLALILDYKVKWAHYTSLGLIIFFSILTFYSAYFDKVTDCGCFGDALKLTPWQSFSKDITLTCLIFIMFMIYRKGQVKDIIQSKEIKFTALVLTLAFNTYLAYLGVASLPIIDFRPYHIGANLVESLKPQEAPIIEYEFEKEGKIYKSQVFLSPEKGYKYRTYKILNPEKSIAKIPDFLISTSDGRDITHEILKGKQILIILHKIRDINESNLAKLRKLINSLENDVSLLVLTADPPNFFKFRNLLGLELNYASVDETVLKAMIRANPGIMQLENGIVKDKWHLNNL